MLQGTHVHTHHYVCIYTIGVHSWEGRQDPAPCPLKGRGSDRSSGGLEEPLRLVCIHSREEEAGLRAKALASLMPSVSGFGLANFPGRPRPSYGQLGATKWGDDSQELGSEIEEEGWQGLPRDSTSRHPSAGRATRVH